MSRDVLGSVSFLTESKHAKKAVDNKTGEFNISSQFCGEQHLDKMVLILLIYAGQHYHVIYGYMDYINHNISLCKWWHRFEAKIRSHCCQMQMYLETQWAVELRTSVPWSLHFCMYAQWCFLSTYCAYIFVFLNKFWNLSRYSLSWVNEYISKQILKNVSFFPKEREEKGSGASHSRWNVGIPYQSSLQLLTKICDVLLWGLVFKLMFSMVWRQGLSWQSKALNPSSGFTTSSWCDLDEIPSPCWACISHLQEEGFGLEYDLSGPSTEFYECMCVFLFIYFRE